VFGLFLSEAYQLVTNKTAIILISRYGLFPLYHNKKRLNILFTENLSRTPGLRVNVRAMTRRASGARVVIAAGYPCPEDTRAYYFIAIYLAARCRK
jgi:hypothetical protein